MKHLSITVISGGSGDNSLIKGLKSLYPHSNVKVVINAYDSGKSTGVCRRLTNTLGVSDIRKNHIRMYKAIHRSHLNPHIISFFEDRYDFTKGHELEEVLTKLHAWDLNIFDVYAKKFFANPETKNETFNDFSVANIIYAQMFKDLGYEQTNKYFCDMLDIDDFVILNSFDNVYIHAHLKDGRELSDEGDIVVLDDPNNKIDHLSYHTEDNYGVNPKAIEALNEADLIIISTGTFWSSIYPSLEYLDFYKYINEAKAKKIWVINSKEDHDAWGVSSNDFIDIVSKLGLNLNDFIILENLDASPILKLKNDKYHIVYKHLGNTDGKNEKLPLARAIFSIYYGLDFIDHLDKLIFDFDGTLWSRDYKVNTFDYLKSLENMHLLNDHLADKSIIFSGSNYEDILKKLNIAFIRPEDFKVDIWADATSKHYKENVLIEVKDDLLIDPKDYHYIDNYLKDKYNLMLRTNSKDEKQISVLKIKPLREEERIAISKDINNVAKAKRLNIKAHMTGRTSIDILNAKNNKAVIYDYLKLNGLDTLYIGDEVDDGNDKEVAARAKYHFLARDVEEANIILKILIEKFEGEL